MRTNYVLIDYENVPVKSLALLKEPHFVVRVFLGANNTKLHRDLVLAMHELGSRAAYVELETSGQNALDFHVAFYLGQLAQVDPTAFFHIISKDTGFDPLISHLHAKKIYAARSASIEEMPCFRPKVEEASATEKVAVVGVAESTPTDPLLALALEDLRRRKASKPRTERTLRSCLRARFPKEVPDADVDSVLKQLRMRGYVRIDGTKATYALPADAS